METAGQHRRDRRCRDMFRCGFTPILARPMPVVDPDVSRIRPVRSAMCRCPAMPGSPAHSSAGPEPLSRRFI
jgi:hypothetical protein